MKFRAVIGLLLLVAAVICAVPLLSRDAVPVDKYNRITVGMTQTQVRQIMGSPARIRHDKPETTTFFYGGLLRLRLNNMEVYFGTDGLVTGKFDDD